MLMLLRGVQPFALGAQLPDPGETRLGHLGRTLEGEGGGRDQGQRQREGKAFRGVLPSVGSA